MCRWQQESSCEGGRRPISSLYGRGFGGLKQIGKILGHPLQDAPLLHVLLEELAHKFAIVLRVLPYGQESGWDAGQVLVKVSHVIDER